MVVTRNVIGVEISRSDADRCINNRDGYSRGLIFFHGRSIFWKTLLLDFLTFVLILSTGDCSVDISEQVITR